MDNQIDVLRDHYFQAIEFLQFESDIIDALPNPNFFSFFDIMTGLTEKLEQSAEEMEKMLNKESDSELKEYIKEELESYRFKLKICKELSENAEELCTIEREAEETGKKSFIFATTSSGNVYLEKDLKDIPEEYYPKVISCLKKIEENYKEENPEHAKSMNSNNKSLSGIHKMKEFKIRVIYRYLTPDIAYIMGVKMKKDSNSNQDIEFNSIRNSHTFNEFQQLKIEAKDEVKKMQLIEENERIKNRIISELEINKRGVKCE